MILVILWCRVMMKKDPVNEKGKRMYFWIAVSGLVYGIGMEFVQKYFIPNRSFDPGDIAADALGCAAGFIYCTRRYIKK
jgi:VanZ family protein